MFGTAWARSPPVGFSGPRIRPTLRLSKTELQAPLCSPPHQSPAQGTGSPPPAPHFSTGFGPAERVPGPNTHSPHPRRAPPQTKPRPPRSRRPQASGLPAERGLAVPMETPQLAAARFRVGARRPPMTSRGYFPAGGRVGLKLWGSHGGHWRRRADAGTRRGRTGRPRAGRLGRSGAAGSHGEDAPGEAGAGPGLPGPWPSGKRTRRLVLPRGLVFSQSDDLVSNSGAALLAR